LKYYENLFIVNPNHEHDRLTKVIDSVKAEITRLKGSVFFLEDWGKKRLAYPIEKHNFGNYVLVQFETENSKLIRELEDWMKLTPEIMSCITVCLKKKPEVYTSGKDLNKQYKLI